jgi:serine/threonine protein phosphatase PrpC
MEIKDIVYEFKDSLSRVASNLIKEANKKGGKDNISAMLIKW